MPGMLLLQTLVRRLVVGESRNVLGPERFDEPHAHFRRGVSREEELQQDLDSSHLLLGGLGEPVG